MKITLRLFVTTITILLSSCQPKSITRIEQLFDIENTISLYDIGIPSDEITSPYVGGDLVNDNIVLINRFGDKLLTVYDINNDYPKLEVLNRGHSSNEMLDINRISHCDNQIYLSGSPKKTVILDGAAIRDSLSFIKIFDEKFTLLSNIIPLEDNCYAGILLHNDTTNHLIRLLDTDLNIIDCFGNLTQYNINMPYHDKVMGLQGKLARSDDKKSFVYTSNFGSIISFFKNNDSEIETIKEYIFEIPVFTSVSKPEAQTYGVAQNGDNICGVISLKAQKDKCYLLYSDKKMNEDNAYMSNLLYVFDFAGNPLKKYVLDDSVRAIIGLRDNDIYFYGTNSNDEPLIKKGKL